MELYAHIRTISLIISLTMTVPQTTCSVRRERKFGFKHSKSHTLECSHLIYLYQILARYFLDNQEKSVIKNITYNKCISDAKTQTAGKTNKKTVCARRQKIFNQTINAALYVTKNTHLYNRLA